MIPGYTKEQALTYVEELADELLPPGYVLDYTGESREIRREGNTMVNVLGVSLVMVFLVLALQFDSFRDPLIILLGSAPWHSSLRWSLPLPASPRLTSIRRWG